MTAKKRASSITPTMTAVRLHGSNGSSQLVCEEVPTPQAAAGEVLVRVHAAAITRGELDWIQYRPAIPSHELSGVVVARGAKVEGVQVGNDVYALSPFDREGAAAEYVAVPAAVIAPKPHTLGFAESATLPLPALTAWQALFVHAQLQSGDRVLIHGAAGGVGSLAVQLARWRGAHVVGTASTENLDVPTRLGADEVIDHTTSRFEELAGSIDVVLDTVGGDTLERSYAIVRPGGRLVSVAEEPSAERATEAGIGAVYFVVEPSREQLIDLAALADSGGLQPLVDAAFPLEEAAKAFAHSLRPHSRGKVVLDVEFAQSDRKGAGDVA